MGCGRTSRKRSRKFRNKGENSSRGVTSSEILLFKWAKTQGFNFRNFQLQVFNFSETGRGMMTKRKISKGHVIISVPHSMLIHTTVIMKGFIGDVIKNSSIEGLTHMQIMSSFLMYEKSCGSKSKWNAYISSLPQSYSTPVYWNTTDINLLPPWVKPLVEHQWDELQNSYEGFKSLKHELEKHDSTLLSCLSFEAYRWAWCTINTRAVYLKQQYKSSAISETKGDVNIALVPILDFLNHSSDAEIVAKFNADDNCYEILALKDICKREQVYINYGPHDNTKLMIDYGFVQSNNQHDAVPFGKDDFHLLKNQYNIPKMEHKFHLITDLDLFKNCCVSKDGFSWNLHLAMIIYSLPADRLHLWKQYQVGRELDKATMNSYTRLARQLIQNKLEHLKVRTEDNEDSVIGEHQKLVGLITSIHQNLLLGTLEKLIPAG